MRCLIYGAGNAREHITWTALERDLKPGRDLFFALYGRNAALEGAPGVRRVSGVDQALDMAREVRADPVLVLSPLDILAYVPSVFARNGIPVWSVPAPLARLEGSKIYAKKVMEEFGIPTPPYRLFNEYQRACAFVEDNWRSGEQEYVIKSDRFLANASLRVMLPETKEEALNGLYELMVRRSLGSGAGYVLLEERVKGPELSLHLLVDSESWRPMPLVQDYKRLFNADQGPNTDGIGSLAQTLSRLEAAADMARIRSSIIEPTVRALRTQDSPYRFVLYIGLVRTARGWMALEFNTRPGNPEWIPLLLLLETPLAEVIAAVREDKLGQLDLAWKDRQSAAVVMATAAGYPFTSRDKYDEAIQGVEATASDLLPVFDNVCRNGGGTLRVNGGRVLGLAAVGTEPEAVAARIYSGLEKIRYNGMYYRTDIGTQGMRL